MVDKGTDMVEDSAKIEEAQMHRGGEEGGEAQHSDTGTERCMLTLVHSHLLFLLSKWNFDLLFCLLTSLDLLHFFLQKYKLRTALFTSLLKLL